MPYNVIASIYTLSEVVNLDLSTTFHFEPAANNIYPSICIVKKPAFIFMPLTFGYLKISKCPLLPAKRLAALFMLRDVDINDIGS